MALSSTEVEYITLTSVGAQALWLHKIWEDTGEKQHGCTLIFCDNLSFIPMAPNLVHYKKSNQLELKYHFVLDIVDKILIESRYYSNNDQLAYAFIKKISKS